MAKLVWDATGERKYETGVKNGVLYPQDSSGAYPTGVAWNGLTGVTESPSGAEANDMWADNIKYGSIRSAETFAATIEAYTYPDEFSACNGEASPTTGVKLGQQSRTPFGFCYRTEIGSDASAGYNTGDPSDDQYKLHLIYNATASPSERAYSTINDSPEAITFSWEVDTTPVPVTGYNPTSSIELDSTKLGATKMAAIEAVLYGGENSTAKLPLPNEVITIINSAT